TLWAATPQPEVPQVEIRNSEVWLVHHGARNQLTRDGRAKIQAELSPANDRVAYYEQCLESEKCTPSIVILDLSGKRLRAVQPKIENGPCASILSMAWTTANSIAAECHINPSLNQYVEIELASGRTIRDLLGYDFTRSPD